MAKTKGTVRIVKKGKPQKQRVFEAVCDFCGTTFRYDMAYVKRATEYGMEDLVKCPARNCDGVNIHAFSDEVDGWLDEEGTE